MKFNVIIEKLELRSCTQQLLLTGEHDCAEIVLWEKHVDGEDYCICVAYWVRDGCKFSLKFVEGRAFGVDVELFMKLAEQGQQLLTNLCNK